VIPKGALAIIMHSCEIPRGNYWGEQVAVASVRTISSQDYIGVLAFTYSPGGVNWEVPMQPATNKPAIIRRIKNMQIGDMPDFEQAMKAATKGLMSVPGASQRHMIIISDGDPSAPSNATINAMVQNRITCSTVGIGYGGHPVNNALLSSVARRTKGRFYQCRNPKRLPQIFVKESKVIRRSLIEEEPFTPQLAYGLAETTRGFGPGAFPPLRGLVLTSPKPAAIEMPLVRAGTEGNDPVMAQWQYELGKVVVFTSGWWPKWGPDWETWDRYGAFWAQVIRWAMRQPGSADFDVITRLEGEKGHVIVEALKRDASYLNNLNIAGRLIDPELHRQAIRLTQTGPGRYEATFDVTTHGQYLLNLSYQTPGDKPGEREQGNILTGLTMAYSPEYRQLEANRPLTEQVLRTAGGRMLTRDAMADDVFHFARPITETRQAVWRWVLIWVLLPLFLLDVASRRLASTIAISIYAEATVVAVLVGLLASAHAPWWSYLGALILAELVGWTIRRDFILPTIYYLTHTVRVLGRAGQRSAESLAHLKGARERAREEMAGGQAMEPPTPPIPLEPLPDRSARYDVGDEKAAEKAGDLTEALGGATKEEAGGGPGGPGRGGQPGEGAGGDLTSRLLRAKKRARQDLDAKKDTGDAGDKPGESSGSNE
jgi:hypothetical protein